MPDIKYFLIFLFYKGLLFGEFTMTKFSEKAIQEAAYFIWENNGRPANTGSRDWNNAINHLSASAALNQAAQIALAKKKQNPNLTMLKSYFNVCKKNHF